MSCPYCEAPKDVTMRVRLLKIENQQKLWLRNCNNCERDFHELTTESLSMDCKDKEIKRKKIRLIQRYLENLFLEKKTVE